MKKLYNKLKRFFQNSKVPIDVYFVVILLIGLLVWKVMNEWEERRWKKYENLNDRLDRRHLPVDAQTELMK